MNIWHEIDEKRISSDKFVSCVEISAGSHNKYELDKETGLLKLDRVLYTSTHYPANYGFIPRTYAEDNDPLDVLILCNESINPMTLVECRPIGVMHMLDNNQIDDKIIAVCINDPFYNEYYSINDLPRHILEEIKHFFTVYKTLEEKETKVAKELEDEEVAKNIIAKAMDKYKQTFVL